MFRMQSTRARIKRTLDVDASIKRLQIDWVQFDPSRVLQILINLLTNALKFTTSEGNGSVRVILSASVFRPVEVKSGIWYIPSKRAQAVAGHVADNKN